MFYSLEKCEMFRVLEEKNSIYKKEYISILELVENPVRNLLEFIKTNYPNYTDHTIQHSYRILRYLYHILSDEMKNDLTATEVFCLILSAMFHDIGMSNSTQNDKELVRNEHGRFAIEPIHMFFEELQIVPSIDRVVRCVSYVCESHTKDLKKMYAEQQFVRRDTINGEMVRYGYLAILLRIGDLMDMEEDRTSYMVQVIFPEYYNKDDSLKHHKRCEELINFNYSNKSIDAVVVTHDRYNYKLWSNWFTFLKDEIIQANTYYFRDFVNGHSIPKFEYLIEPADGANFCTEEIRFEIDDKGALWNIISSSIYTTEYDFLRELTQNAVDACLLDCYLNQEVELSGPFQRVWPVEKNCVNILFSEEMNELIILDNGVGMNMNTLRSYLFKTADSGYKHINVEREFLFPAIAKFGIGFVACLTKADNIKLLTQEPTASEQIIVEIEKDSNLAFIERRRKSRHQGTAIRLKLKDKHTFNGIMNYLKNNFCFSAVKIELINLDVLKDIYINDFDLGCEELDDVYELLSKKIKFAGESKKKIETHDDIGHIILECDSLRFDISNVNEDEEFSLSDLIKRHKIILKEVNKYVDIIGRELLDELKKFTKVTIDLEHKKYEMLMSKIISILNEHKKKYLDIPVNRFYAMATSIGDVRWRSIMKDDICLVYLNNDFQIEDVRYEIEPHTIKEGFGIIYIKTDYVDVQYGIEFSGINAFFFEKGNFATNLVRVHRHNDSFWNDDTSDIISLEELYDIQYQLELKYLSEEEQEIYHRNIRDLEEEKFSYNLDVIFGQKNIKIAYNLHTNQLQEETLEGVSFIPNAMYSKKYMGEFVPVFDKSLFFQDGIKIDINIGGLIPFSVGHYRCNLFGASRFELNVTRHDINRDSALINEWMEKYGKIIQREVIKNVISKLEQCGLENIDLKMCLMKYGSGIFEKSAYEQFVELLKNNNRAI